jgi:hypothetical protein
VVAARTEGVADVARAAGAGDAEPDVVDGEPQAAAVRPTTTASTAVRVRQAAVARPTASAAVRAGPVATAGPVAAAEPVAAVRPARPAAEPGSARM